MKNWKKRALSWLLTISMALGMLPGISLPAFAAGTATSNIYLDAAGNPAGSVTVSGVTGDIYIVLAAECEMTKDGETIPTEGTDAHAIKIAYADKISNEKAPTYKSELPHILLKYSVTGSIDTPTVIPVGSGGFEVQPANASLERVTALTQSAIENNTPGYTVTNIKYCVLISCTSVDLYDELENITLVTPPTWTVTAEVVNDPTLIAAGATVQVGGGSAGTTSSTVVHQGDPVNIKATVPAGYHFVRWDSDNASGTFEPDGATKAETTYTAQGDDTLTAVILADSDPELVVTPASKTVEFNSESDSGTATETYTIQNNGDKPATLVFTGSNGLTDSAGFLAAVVSEGNVFSVGYDKTSIGKGEKATVTITWTWDGYVSSYEGTTETVFTLPYTYDNGTKSGDCNFSLKLLDTATARLSAIPGIKYTVTEGYGEQSTTDVVINIDSLGASESLYFFYDPDALMTSVTTALNGSFGELDFNSFYVENTYNTYLPDNITDFATDAPGMSINPSGTTTVDSNGKFTFKLPLNMKAGHYVGTITLGFHYSDDNGTEGSAGASIPVDITVKEATEPTLTANNITWNVEQGYTTAGAGNKTLTLTNVGKADATISGYSWSGSGAAWFSFDTEPANTDTVPANAGTKPYTLKLNEGLTVSSGTSQSFEADLTITYTNNKTVVSHVKATVTKPAADPATITNATLVESSLVAGGNANLDKVTLTKSDGTTQEVAAADLATNNVTVVGWKKGSASEAGTALSGTGTSVALTGVSEGDYLWVGLKGDGTNVSSEEKWFRFGPVGTQKARLDVKVLLGSEVQESAPEGITVTPTTADLAANGTQSVSTSTAATSGYKFKGWATNTDGTGTANISGAAVTDTLGTVTFTMPSPIAATTIYAKYVAIPILKGTAHDATGSASDPANPTTKPSVTVANSGKAEATNVTVAVDDSRFTIADSSTLTGTGEKNKVPTTDSKEIVLTPSSSLPAGEYTVNVTITYDQDGVSKTETVPVKYTVTAATSNLKVALGTGVTSVKVKIVAADGTEKRNVSIGSDTTYNVLSTDTVTLTSTVNTAEGYTPGDWTYTADHLNGTPTVSATKETIVLGVKAATIVTANAVAGPKLSLTTTTNGQTVATNNLTTGTKVYEGTLTNSGKAASGKVTYKLYSDSGCTTEEARFTVSPTETASIGYTDGSNTDTITVTPKNTNLAVDTYTFYLEVEEANGYRTVETITFTVGNSTIFTGKVQVKLDGATTNTKDVAKVQLKGTGDNSDFTSDAITVSNDDDATASISGLAINKTYEIWVAYDGTTFVDTGLTLGNENLVTVDFYTVGVKVDNTDPADLSGVTTTAGSSSAIQSEEDATAATSTVVQKGKTVTIGAAVGTGSDFSFVNWTDDGNNNAEVSTSGSYTFSVDGTKNYTAHFAKNVEWTLRYDPNLSHAPAGATPLTLKAGTTVDMPASVTVAPSGAANLPVNTTNRVLPGFVFKGWDANAAATTPTYAKEADSARITLTGDTVLYAIWERAAITFTAATMPGGRYGELYNKPISSATSGLPTSTDGGTFTYAKNAEASALPGGLDLNSDNLNVEGTPYLVGSVTIPVTVTLAEDSADPAADGYTAVQANGSLTISVDKAVPSVTVTPSGVANGAAINSATYVVKVTGPRYKDNGTWENVTDTITYTAGTKGTPGVGPINVGDAEFKLASGDGTTFAASGDTAMTVTFKPNKTDTSNFGEGNRKKQDDVWASATANFTASPTGNTYGISVSPARHSYQTADNKYAHEGYEQITGTNGTVIIVKSGKDTVAPKEFTITNTGNQSTGNITVTSDTTDFTVTWRNQELEAKDATATFTVVPAEGCEKGLHTGTITVESANSGSKTVTVVFYVDDAKTYTGYVKPSWQSVSGTLTAGAIPEGSDVGIKLVPLGKGASETSVGTMGTYDNTNGYPFTGLELGKSYSVVITGTGNGDYLTTAVVTADAAGSVNLRKVEAGAIKSEDSATLSGITFTGTGWYVDGQTVTLGAADPATVSTVVYDFGKWVASANATATSVCNDKTYSFAAAAAAKYYATYTAQVAENYVLSYDDNIDGVGVWVPASQTVAKVTGGDTKTYVSSNEPSREGYVFDGWAIAADGDVVYAKGEEIILTQKNTTLYAHWTAGAIGDVTNATITKQYGDNCRVQITAPTTTDGAGVTFKVKVAEGNSLPGGLMLDETTGVISGRPWEICTNKATIIVVTHKYWDGRAGRGDAVSKEITVTSTISACAPTLVMDSIANVVVGSKFTTADYVGHVSAPILKTQGATAADDVWDVFSSVVTYTNPVGGGAVVRTGVGTIDPPDGDTDKFTAINTPVTLTYTPSSTVKDHNNAASGTVHSSIYTTTTASIAMNDILEVSADGSTFATSAEFTSFMANAGYTVGTSGTNGATADNVVSLKQFTLRNNSDQATGKLTLKWGSSGTATSNLFTAAFADNALNNGLAAKTVSEDTPTYASLNFTIVPAANLAASSNPYVDTLTITNSRGVSATVKVQFTVGKPVKASVQTLLQSVEDYQKGEDATGPTAAQLSGDNVELYGYKVSDGTLETTAAKKTWSDANTRYEYAVDFDTYTKYVVEINGELVPNLVITVDALDKQVELFEVTTAVETLDDLKVGAPSGAGYYFKGQKVQIGAAGAPAGFEFVNVQDTTATGEDPKVLTTDQGYVTAMTTPTAYTAKYKAVDTPETVKLTYDVNGGTAPEGEVEPDSEWLRGEAVNKDSSVTILGCNYTREGYTFAGWDATVDGKTTHYDAGATFVITADTTLVAKWVAGVTLEGGSITIAHKETLADNGLIHGAVGGTPGYTYARTDVDSVNLPKEITFNGSSHKFTGTGAYDVDTAANNTATTAIKATDSKGGEATANWTVTVVRAKTQVTAGFDVPEGTVYVGENFPFDDLGTTNLAVEYLKNDGTKNGDFTKNKILPTATGDVEGTWSIRGEADPKVKPGENTYILVFTPTDKGFLPCETEVTITGTAKEITKATVEITFPAAETKPNTTAGKVGNTESDTNKMASTPDTATTDDYTVTDVKWSVAADKDFDLTKDTYVLVTLTAGNNWTFGNGFVGQIKKNGADEVLTSDVSVVANSGDMVVLKYTWPATETPVRGLSSATGPLVYYSRTDATNKHHSADATGNKTNIGFTLNKSNFTVKTVNSVGTVSDALAVTDFILYVKPASYSDAAYAAGTDTLLDTENEGAYSGTYTFDSTADPAGTTLNGRDVYAAYAPGGTVDTDVAPLKVGTLVVQELTADGIGAPGTLPTWEYEAGDNFATNVGESGVTTTVNFNTTPTTGLTNTDTASYAVRGDNYGLTDTAAADDNREHFYYMLDKNGDGSITTDDEEITAETALAVDTHNNKDVYACYTDVNGHLVSTKVGTLKVKNKGLSVTIEDENEHDAEYGDTLTAKPAEGTTPEKYVWEKNTGTEETPVWTPIPGATGKDYVPKPEDIGEKIRVTITDGTGAETSSEPKTIEARSLNFDVKAWDKVVDGHNRNIHAYDTSDFTLKEAVDVDDSSVYGGILPQDVGKTFTLDLKAALDVESDKKNGENEYIAVENGTIVRPVYNGTEVDKTITWPAITVSTDVKNNTTGGYDLVCPVRTDGEGEDATETPLYRLAAQAQMANKGKIYSAEDKDVVHVDVSFKNKPVVGTQIPSAPMLVTDSSETQAGEAAGGQTYVATWYVSDTQPAGNANKGTKVEATGGVMPNFAANKYYTVEVKVKPTTGHKYNKGDPTQFYFHFGENNGVTVTNDVVSDGKTIGGVVVNGNVHTMWYTFGVTGNPPADFATAEGGAYQLPVLEHTLYYAATANKHDGTTRQAAVDASKTIAGDATAVPFTFDPTCTTQGVVAYADGSTKKLGTTTADDTLVYGTDWWFVWGESPAVAKDQKLTNEGTHHTFTDTVNLPGSANTGDSLTKDGKNLYVQVGDKVLERPVTTLQVKELTAEPDITIEGTLKLDYTAGAKFDASGVTSAAVSFNKGIAGLGVEYKETTTITSFTYELADGTALASGESGTEMVKDNHNGKLVYICYTDVNGHKVRTPVGTLRIDDNSTTAAIRVQNQTHANGNTQYGDTLKAVVTGTESAGAALEYKWQRWNSGTGAWADIKETVEGEQVTVTGDTYIASKADVGTYVRVMLTKDGDKAITEGSEPVSDSADAADDLTGQENSNDHVYADKKTITAEWTWSLGSKVWDNTSTITGDVSYDATKLEAQLTHGNETTTADAFMLEAAATAAFQNGTVANNKTIDLTFASNANGLKTNDNGTDWSDFYVVEPIGPYGDITALQLTWDDFEFTGKVKRYDGTDKVYGSDNDSLTAENSGKDLTANGAGKDDNLWALKSGKYTDHAEAIQSALTAKNVKYSSSKSLEVRGTPITTGTKANGHSTISLTFESNDASILAPAGTFSFGSSAINPKRVEVEVTDLTAPTVSKDATATLIDGAVKADDTVGDENVPFQVAGAIAPHADNATEVDITVLDVTAGSSDGISWTDNDYLLVWKGDGKALKGGVSGGTPTKVEVLTAPTVTYGDELRSASLKVKITFEDNSTSERTTTFGALESLNIKAIVQHDTDSDGDMDNYAFAGAEGSKAGWSNGTEAADTTTTVKFYVAADGLKADATQFGQVGIGTCNMTVKQKALNVTPTWNLNESPKVGKYYDGTRNALGTLKDASANNLTTDATGTMSFTYDAKAFPDDAVAVNTSDKYNALFGDKNAADNKPITVTLDDTPFTGAQANRYKVGAVAQATGSIKRRPVTVTFATPTVPIDSTDTNKTKNLYAQFGHSNVGDIVDGDTLTVAAVGTYAAVNKVVVAGQAADNDKGTGSGENNVTVAGNSVVCTDPNYTVTVTSPINGNVTANTITTVTVTYTAPVKGDTAAEEIGYTNSAEVTNPETHWYKVDNATAWTDIDTPLTFGEAEGNTAFEADGYYMVTATFKANAGYQFNTDITTGTQFSINGADNNANQISYNNGAATVKYIFHVPADGKTNVSHVHVFFKDIPVTDETVMAPTKVTLEGETVPGTGDAFTAKWYEHTDATAAGSFNISTTTATPMAADAEYAPGKYYTVAVDVKPGAGYQYHDGTQYFFDFGTDNAYQMEEKTDFPAANGVWVHEVGEEENKETIYTLFYTFQTPTGNPGGGVNIGTLKSLYYETTANHNEGGTFGVNTTANNTPTPGGKKDVGFKLTPADITVTYADDSTETFEADKYGENNGWALFYGSDNTKQTPENATTRLDKTDVLTEANHNGKILYLRRIKADGGMGELVTKTAATTLAVHKLEVDSISATADALKTAYNVGDQLEAPSSWTTAPSTVFNGDVGGLNVTYSTTVGGLAEDKTKTAITTYNKYYYKLGFSETGAERVDVSGGDDNTTVAAADAGKTLFVCYTDVNGKEVMKSLGTITVNGKIGSIGINYNTPTAVTYPESESNYLDNTVVTVPARGTTGATIWYNTPDASTFDKDGNAMLYKDEEDAAMFTQNKYYLVESVFVPEEKYSFAGGTSTVVTVDGHPITANDIAVPTGADDGLVNAKAAYNSGTGKITVQAIYHVPADVPDKAMVVAITYPEPVKEQTPATAPSDLADSNKVKMVDNGTKWFKTDLNDTTAESLAKANFTTIAGGTASTDAFVPNTYYMVEGTITPKDSKVAFKLDGEEADKSDNTQVIVNGVRVYVDGEMGVRRNAKNEIVGWALAVSDGTNIKAMYISKTAAEDKVITEVTTGLTQPVPNGDPDETANTTLAINGSGSIVTNTGLTDAGKVAVTWHNDTDNADLAADGKFEQDKVYSASFTVTTEDSYTYLDVADPASYVTWHVQGLDVAGGVGTPGKTETKGTGDDKLEVTVTRESTTSYTVKITFPKTTADTTIGNVSVTYVEPVKGESPAVDKIYTSPNEVSLKHELVADGALGTTWYEGSAVDNNKDVNGEHEFTDGPYTVQAHFKAQTGFKFVEGTTEFFVNGNDCTANATIAENGLSATVYYTFTGLNKVIKSVNPSVTAPVAQAQAQANVIMNEALNKDNVNVFTTGIKNKDSMAITWSKGSTTGGSTTWTDVTNDVKTKGFDYSTVYKAEFDVEVNTGYTFLNDTEGNDYVDFLVNNGLMTINGAGTKTESDIKVTTSTEAATTKYHVTIEFPATKDDIHDDFNVYVNTTVPAKHGQRVPNVYVVSTEPYEATKTADVADLYWEESSNGTDWTKVAENTPFKADHYYRVVGKVQLKSASYTNYDITNLTKFYIADVQIPQADETENAGGHEGWTATFEAMKDSKIDPTTVEGAYDDATVYTVTLTFPKLESNASKTIVKVASNVTDPRAGQAIPTDETARLLLVQNETGDDLKGHVESTAVTWQKKGSDGSFGAPGTTFDFGGTYKASFTLKVKDVSYDSGNGYKYLNNEDSDDNYVDFLIQGVTDNDGKWINGAGGATTHKTTVTTKLTAANSGEYSYDVEIVFSEIADKADIFTILGLATVPVAGDDIKNENITVPDNEPYKLQIGTNIWYTDEACGTPATGKFNPGTTYWAKLSVQMKDTMKESYQFTTDTDGYINDNDEATTVTCNPIDGTPTAVTLVRPFTVANIPINVRISSSIPTAEAAVKTVNDSIKIPADLTTPHYSISNFAWCGSDDRPLAEGTNFDAGKTYKLIGTVTPDAGYSLPEIKEGYSWDETHRVATKIEALKDGAGKLTGSYKITFEYPIPKAGDSSSDILTSIKTPEVGKKAEAAKSPNDSVEIKETTWKVDSGTEQTPDKVKFDYGHNYTVYIDIPNVDKTGKPLNEGDTVYLNGETYKLGETGTTKTDGGWTIQRTWNIPKKATDTEIIEKPVYVPSGGGGGGGGGGSSEIIVTYKLGEVGITEDLTAEKVKKNKSPAKVPKVEGIETYTFIGWSETDPAKTTGKPILVDPKTFKITKDKTFYAVYEVGEHTAIDHTHYVIGYPNGTFGPTDDISRAEVATIIARSCLEGFVEGSSYGNPGNYSDVGKHWAASAIDYCTMHGVFTGYKDGTFKPNQPITRQELAVVVARLAGVKSNAGMPFSDADKISKWARDGVYTTYANGWVKGYTDGTFRPLNNITRAETVKVFNGYLGRGVDKAGLSDMKEYVHTGVASNNTENGNDEYMTWPDVPKTYWAYYEIVEAANDHTFYWPDEEKQTPPEHWSNVWIDEVWLYHDNPNDGGRSTRQ